MRAFARILLALVIAESALGYSLARGLRPPTERLFDPPPTIEQRIEQECDVPEMVPNGSWHDHVCDFRSI